LEDSRIAQPDLANGTRFQVLMKERKMLFHLHLESRAVRMAVRKIRLRYPESTKFSADRYFGVLVRAL
jgi:hypothetical protein